MGDTGRDEAGGTAAAAIARLESRIDDLIRLLLAQHNPGAHVTLTGAGDPLGSGGGSDGSSNAATVAAVRLWDVADVCAWLGQQSGLEAHAEVFRQHGLRGADLADLCHADLVSIGMARLGERKALLRAVAGLLRAPLPSPPLTTKS